MARIEKMVGLFVGQPRSRRRNQGRRKSPVTTPSSGRLGKETVLPRKPSFHFRKGGQTHFFFYKGRPSRGGGIHVRERERERAKGGVEELREVGAEGGVINRVVG